jgi:hypothetical protein
MGDLGGWAWRALARWHAVGLVRSAYLADRTANHPCAGNTRVTQSHASSMPSAASASETSIFQKVSASEPSVLAHCLAKIPAALAGSARQSLPRRNNLPRPWSADFASAARRPLAGSQYARGPRPILAPTTGDFLVNIVNKFRTLLKIFRDCAV